MDKKSDKERSNHCPPQNEVWLSQLYSKTWYYHTISQTDSINMAEQTFGAANLLTDKK